MEPKIWTIFIYPEIKIMPNLYKDHLGNVDLRERDYNFKRSTYIPIIDRSQFITLPKGAK